MSDIDEALNKIKELITEPKGENYLRSFALALDVVGDKEMALELLLGAYELGGKTSIAILAESYCEGSLGVTDKKKAIQYFKEGIEANDFLTMQTFFVQCNKWNIGSSDGIDPLEVSLSFLAHEEFEKLPPQRQQILARMINEIVTR